jgi:hypothetical protein
MSHSEIGDKNLPLCIDVRRSHPREIMVSHPVPAESIHTLEDESMTIQMHSLDKHGFLMGPLFPSQRSWTYFIMCRVFPRAAGFTWIRAWAYVNESQVQAQIW